MKITEIKNSEEYKKLESELKSLKKEHTAKTSQPIPFNQNQDNSFEVLLEKGSELVTSFIEQQTEIEKVRSKTEIYEIDKKYSHKEKELTSKNALVKRQSIQQTVIISGSIIITGILAFTNNLTDGFLTIVAVIIGASLKNNILDFIKDFNKANSKNDD